MKSILFYHIDRLVIFKKLSIKRVSKAIEALVNSQSTFLARKPFHTFLIFQLNNITYKSINRFVF